MDRTPPLRRAILLTYLVCLVTTTTEGVQNLLFPLYLDHYGQLLAGGGLVLCFAVGLSSAKGRSALTPSLRAKAPADR